MPRKKALAPGAWAVIIKSDRLPVRHLDCLLMIRPDKKIGAIAQLGERYNGIVEVSGSIPLSSTKLFNDLTSLSSAGRTRWVAFPAIFSRHTPHFPKTSRQCSGLTLSTFYIDLQNADAKPLKKNDFCRRKGIRVIRLR